MNRSPGRGKGQGILAVMLGAGVLLAAFPAGGVPLRGVSVLPAVAAPAVVTGRQGSIERQTDAASLDVQAGTPRFLPHSNDGNPVTRMPLVSPNVFIKMAQSYGFGPNITVLSETNLVTGRETPLLAINAVIRKNWGIDDKGVITKIPDGSIPGLSFDLYNPCLSPDGHYLLWESRAKNKPAWTAMTLDSSWRADWPRRSWDGGNGAVGWMRDGVHFVEISQHGLALYASVCRLDAPGRAQVFPLTPPADVQLSPMLTGSDDVCFTADGHGWVMDVFGTRAEIIPGPHAWTLRAAPLFDALDPNITDGKPAEAALSPDGNRLVWHDSPAGKADPMHLYMSRLDGSAARMIYTVPDGPGVGYSPKWTPDGRGIVFSGRNGLYLLPLYPSATPSDDAPLRVTLGPFPTCPGEVFAP